MPEFAAPSLVRVAVLSNDKIGDVALPLDLPVRDIVPAVQQLVAHDDPRSASGVRFGLAPLGGTPFSPDATLGRVGVADGDVLVLAPVPKGPPATGVIEDVADAAALLPNGSPRWDGAAAQRAACAGFVVCAASATAFFAAQWAAGAALASRIGLVALTAVAVIAALATRKAAGLPTVCVTAAALIPIATAFAAVVPGDSALSRALLASAGVLAWSLLSALLTDRAAGLFAWTAVVGAAFVLASAANLLWTLPYALTGCGLLLFALAVVVQASPLAALWARLPIPAVPAPGDPVPDALPDQVLRDLPRRVRIARSRQSGLLGGAVLVQILGSALIVADKHPGALAWYVVVAATAASALRARVWDSALCKAWLLATPFLMSLVFVALFAAQGRFAAGGVALGSAIAQTIVWAIVATNPRVADPEAYPIPARRSLGLAAAALDVSLLPAAGYLCGAFQAVLGV